MLQFGPTLALWLSPVIYAPDMIPHAFHVVYHVNPMVGPLLAFRAVLFDGLPLPLYEWAYSFVSSAVVLALGIWSFRQTEIRLVDRL